MQAQAVKKKPPGRFDTVVKWISTVMAIIASITLAIMMMITVIDVTGRFVFLKPLKGAFELTGLLLILAATWGMGYCQRLKGHIRISFLYERFPRRGQALADVLAYSICLSTSVMIVWRTFIRMKEYMFLQLGGVTETLSIPLYPFMLLLALGFGWLCVTFLVDLYKSIIEVIRR